MQTQKFESIENFVYFHFNFNFSYFNFLILLFIAFLVSRYQNFTLVAEIVKFVLETNLFFNNWPEFHLDNSMPDNHLLF